MARRKDALAPRSNGQDTSLFGARVVAPYNADERRFSIILRARLDKLLSGDANELPLLRRYADDPNRIGIMPLPPRINVKALRLPVVEGMVRNVIALLHDGTPGGPPIQKKDRYGHIVDVQEFTTKFPHILLVRKDVYDASTRQLLATLWSARRVQNQRAQILVNRGLDIATLGLELIRFAVVGR